MRPGPAADPWMEALLKQGSLDKQQSLLSATYSSFILQITLPIQTVGNKCNQQNLGP